VDESAITTSGESAPVTPASRVEIVRRLREGRVFSRSDGSRFQYTSIPAKRFLDRMIKLVGEASRQKTPNEIALKHSVGRAVPLIFLG